MSSDDLPVQHTTKLTTIAASIRFVLLVRVATLVPPTAGDGLRPGSVVTCSLVSEGHRRNGFSAAADELFLSRPLSARIITRICR